MGSESGHSDPIIEHVMLDLAEHFGDLDDSDEAPFGEYGMVARTGSTLIVHHESEPWGIEITVRRFHG